MKASDGALHGSRIIDDFLTTFMGVRRSLLFDTDDILSGFHCCSPQIGLPHGCTSKQTWQCFHCVEDNKTSGSAVAYINVRVRLHIVF